MASSFLSFCLHFCAQFIMDRLDSICISSVRAHSALHNLQRNTVGCHPNLVWQSSSGWWNAGGGLGEISTLSLELFILLANIFIADSSPVPSKPNAVKGDLNQQPLSPQSAFHHPEPFVVMPSSFQVLLAPLQLKESLWWKAIWIVLSGHKKEEMFNIIMIKQI